MSNIAPSGSSHEHNLRLSPPQREAVLRRFAPRFTRGQILADRAGWVMHRIAPEEIEPVQAVVNPQPQETQRTVGSNVISMEAWRQQQEAAKRMGRINLQGPDDIPTYDLDAIREVVQNSSISSKSYPMNTGDPYDQKAA